MNTPAPPVSLLALYRLFFVVGLCSFGGGLTAWFHREVVLVRKWMTDDEFFSGYSLAQLLPGVNSTNMAVYIGQHLRGAIGSIVALAALLSGPFFIVIAAALAYNRLLEIPGFVAAMAGIATAAVGMIFRMGLTSAQASLRHVPSVLVMVATLVAVGVLQWPFLPVIAVLAPISIFAAWRRKGAQPETAPRETTQARTAPPEAAQPQPARDDA
jgi:chromate transporter